MKLKLDLQSEQANTLAYAFFRTAFGVLLMINGWNKWVALPESADDFPDPLGIGSAVSIYLAIFCEFICGLAIALGLMTRLTSFPVAVTFTVAVFLVHGNDPFDVKQVAILYLIASIYMLVNGSGRFSLDGFIRSEMTDKQRSKA